MQWEDDLDVWMDDMEEFDLDTGPPDPSTSGTSRSSAPCPPKAAPNSSKEHGMRATSNRGQQSSQINSKMAPQNRPITSSVTLSSQSFPFLSQTAKKPGDQGVGRNSFGRKGENQKVYENQNCQSGFQSAKGLTVKSGSPKNIAQTCTNLSRQTNLRTNPEMKHSQREDITEKQFSDDDDFFDDLDDFDISNVGNVGACSIQYSVSVPQNVNNNNCTLINSNSAKNQAFSESKLLVTKNKFLKNTDNVGKKEADISLGTSINQRPVDPPHIMPHIVRPLDNAGGIQVGAGETTRPSPAECTSLGGAKTKLSGREESVFFINDGAYNYKLNFCRCFLCAA